MQIDDHISKDIAFGVIVVMLFSCFLGYCVFSYLGYSEAEHQGLFQLFSRGYDFALGVVSGIVGTSAMSKAYNGLKSVPSAEKAEK